MIIVGGKNTGKRLARKIAEALMSHGTCTVAALSSLGVDRLQTAGQRVANITGRKVSANPIQSEVELNGVYRVALLMEFTFKDIPS